MAILGVVRVGLERGLVTHGRGTWRWVKSEWCEKLFGFQ